MVGIMASAYKGLTEEEQERVFLMATGKDDFSNLDSNFCQGFAACHDEVLNPWWSTWGANQRDVYFYIKTDPNDDDSWEYYCRYSMDTNNAEFDDTIREMLAVTEPLVEEVTVGDEEETSNTTAVLESPIPENSTITSDFPVLVTEPLVEEVTVGDEEETSNATAVLESFIPEDNTTTSDLSVPMSNAPVPIVSENMNDTSSSNFIAISSTLFLLVLVMPFLGWFILL